MGSSYVSCLYEKEWCDGINEEVSVEENDVLVKFLHPTDPSVHLHWPASDGKCWAQVNTYYNCSQFQLLTLQSALIPS